VTVPNLYPVSAQSCGIAKDASDGAPVAMVDNLLTNSLMFVDTPVWLTDNSNIGGMDAGGTTVQGKLFCAVTGGGQVFTDTFPYLLANILGDVTTTGTASPFTHKVSVMNPAAANSYHAQPVSDTLTAYNGVAASSGAWQIASCALSQLVIEFDAAAGLLTYTFTANGWPSVVAGVRPTSAPSAVKPIAAWRGQMGLGGPASGGTLVSNLATAKITINREIENQFMADGTQNPQAIGRGAVSSVDFEATFLATDSVVWTDMMNNTGPQVQWLFNASASQQVQLDMQVARFKVAKPNYGSKMVRWDTSGSGERNSTNAGATGGLASFQATVVNTVASGHYT